MTKFLLAAGVAAMAIAAPAAAKPGNGGGGHGHAAAKAEGRGHGQARAQVKARGGGKAARAQVQARGNVKRGGGGKAARAQVQARGNVKHGGGDRAMARSQQKVRANRPDRARVRQAQRAFEVRGHANKVREARNHQMDRVREARNDRVRDIRDLQNRRIERVRDTRGGNDIRFAERGGRGWGLGGCPPGLAKKHNGCMPPGQAKKLVGANFEQARRIAAMNQLPTRLRSIYPDNRDYYYRYGDGYVYRVNRTDNVISSLLPLFGLGYSAGQAFPAGYSNYGLPMAYQPFYPSTPSANYRYANGYVYEVDPYTGLIRDVDPMLGYGYGYGQMMPSTYSAYNVPYQYRPYYADTSDAYYRYAPGAIYQVDPKTSLITAVAALLAPNAMTVGQQMPMGYSAYNVPYAYRSNYYDTANDWYRYSNGSIYRVDPATQLVTALVASALT